MPFANLDNSNLKIDYILKIVKAHLKLFNPLNAF